MICEKWREILFILLLLANLLSIFGCPIWCSELIVYCLAALLPHHSDIRKQEWLACLDELPTATEKAKYAVSLIPTVALLILFYLGQVLLYRLADLKTHWISYTDKAYIGNRPLVTDYSSVRVYDIPIILKDHIDR